MIQCLGTARLVLGAEPRIARDLVDLASLGIGIGSFRRAVAIIGKPRKTLQDKRGIEALRHQLRDALGADIPGDVAFKRSAPSSPMVPRDFGMVLDACSQTSTISLAIRHGLKTAKAGPSDGSISILVVHAVVTGPRPPWAAYSILVTLIRIALPLSIL
jgi:hypothetical protein